METNNALHLTPESPETLSEGGAYSFEVPITAEAIDQFARLSGDDNDLHLDEAFAKSRGFRGRVAHGAYLGSLVSRLIGTRLPGRDAVIHQTQLTFHAPAYVGDTVTVRGKIERKIDSVNVLEVSIRITESGTDPRRLLASGKVRVGFTHAGSNSEMSDA